MADNDNPRIRYDDFISNIQPDPAKPESTILLSGFVGHGPEGHARIYPDPTLGTWYDVPEGDVVHSTPIADSKLGGSYVWVRASAQIKPGSAAAAAGSGTGGGAEAAPAAAAQPAGGIAPQPTPATHCFICPPHSQAVHCWTAPVVCDILQPPTPATVCPPHTQNCTPATICTLHGHCPPGGLQTHFLCTQGLATFCGCTPGIDCNAAPGNVQTQAPICTQGFPTFCGCTPGIDCGGLAARGAPQQAAVGINPTPASHCFVCDPKAAAAMQPTPTVQTHCFICPPHTQAVHCWTAPVVCDTMQMPTPATRCFICPPVNQTFATVCTQIGCPTHQIHCPTQPVVCNLQPTQPVVCGVLPPSFGCTQGCQQGGAQQQPAAAMAAPAHPNTAATLCTQQPVCPPHTVHNSMCICPTPSAVHQCGGQTPFTPTIPQFTVVGACPTFGVCPSIACTFTPMQNGVFTPFGR
jgi:hypothetical protein